MNPNGTTTQWVEAPDPETDYHGHPNYSKVFLSLIFLFAISLIIGYFISAKIGIALIFFTAVIKAALVVGNFMHLKYEPKLIWVAVGIAVFIFLAFYFGVLPDVTFIKHDLAK